MKARLPRPKLVVLPVTPIDRRMTGPEPQFARRDPHRKNPLRVIVRRRIRMLEFHYHAPYLRYTETLKCGHIYVTMPILPEQFTAKRRRCAECAAQQQNASE
jgi:hypothetical protein